MPLCLRFAPVRMAVRFVFYGPSVGWKGKDQTAVAWDGIPKDVDGMLV